MLFNLAGGGGLKLFLLGLYGVLSLGDGVFSRVLACSIAYFRTELTQARGVYYELSYSGQAKGLKPYLAKMATTGHLSCAASKRHVLALPLPCLRD